MNLQVDEGLLQKTCGLCCEPALSNVDYFPDVAFVHATTWPLGFVHCCEEDRSSPIVVSNVTGES